MNHQKAAFGGGRMSKLAVYPFALIGKVVEVVDSNNKSLVGIKGEVIDETKNTLHVRCKDEVKVLLKSTIKIKLSSGEVIEGNKITKRPQERIKGN